MHLPRPYLKSSLVVPGPIGPPVMAHITQVSGDVAGLWHIEPDHSPKAGEPAQIWIALTQRGGRPIPLEQCRCRLSIVDLGDPDATPLEPSLSALSPETYQQVPGAAVRFPAVGEYRLTLSGSPQGTGSFQPFELSTTVVVAAGQASVQREPAPEQTTGQQTPATEPGPGGSGSQELWQPGLAIAIGLALGLIAYGLWRRTRS